MGVGAGESSEGYAEMFSLHFVWILEKLHAQDEEDTWLLSSQSIVHPSLLSVKRTEADSSQGVITWCGSVHSLGILQQILPFQTPPEVSVPK